MGIVTWVAIGVIVLVAIGLGWGVFFSGLLKGAEIVAPVVQNATDEAIENADDDSATVTTSDSDDEVDRNTVVVVQTEKTVYKVRDPVVIVVKNQGNDKVVFSDSTPDVEIRNEDTGKTYDVTVTQVNTELEPGESITITWDSTAEDIESGTYVAVVKADDGTLVGESKFTIET